MPRLFSPPQLPPLKPLEHLVMGLTLLLLASLLAKGATSAAEGNVVLAEHLGSSKADRENVPPADR